MKIQDIAFLGLLALLIVLRKKKIFLYVGLVCILLAIPLFATWTFFTGERLVWYGAAYIGIFVLSSLFSTGR